MSLVQAFLIIIRACAICLMYRGHLAESETRGTRLRVYLRDMSTRESGTNRTINGNNRSNCGARIKLSFPTKKRTDLEPGDEGNESHFAYSLEGCVCS